MRQLSIRQQVAWVTFVPLFIMAIGMEAFFLQDRFSDMDKDLLDQGELIAHQLAVTSEYGVFSSNQPFLHNLASSALQQPDVHAVAVLNSASEILASDGEFFLPVKSEIIGKSLATYEHANRKTPKSIEKMDHVIILPLPANGDQNSLWLYHKIIPTQVALDESNPEAIKPLGAVIVEISKLRYTEHKTKLLRTTLILTVLFLIFTFYLVFLASRSIIDPIRSLSKAVQDIGEGKLGTRVALTTRVSELATLARGLNTTTEHLQREQEILQQCIEEATQALREKKEEAERASQGKSHFLAVASHDLRQPLHALGLYVAELQRRASGTGQQHLVEQIGSSIEALSNLLNTLLDISKLDAGVVIPQVQPCNMTAMLGRIASDFQMLASQRNIRLIARPFHGYVSSDPQLLERILMNLISNALRYTGQNGSVLIACRKRGANLRIEVRDNGIGISETDQKSVFSEFFQVTKSSPYTSKEPDSTKGLGLGLSIVDRLVKLLGHRIELRSILGKGSVFAVEVPVAGQEFLHQPAIQAPKDELEFIESSPSGKKLLIVDDDAAVLSSTSGLLRSWGYIVTQAASFEQVEQFLRDGLTWDFIISDYQLGEEKNGFDVIALVRQYHSKPIPCILISGDTSQTVLEKANKNCHHFLQKPVKPGKLRSLIEHILKETGNS